MDHDVIIAGAGPVGLFLACELRLAGCSVLVLEREPDPHSPLKQLPFGLRGLWGPAIEAFYRRGLLDAIADEPRVDPSQPRPGSLRGDRGPAGHFAGIPFDYANIDQARWPYRLPGPADQQLGATMAHLERVLAARARELGAELRRGVAVDEVAQTPDGVVVHGQRAHFLVGCDGGRSAVRKRAGIDFVGSEPLFTGYSIQVDLADPAALPRGRHYTPTGMFTHWQPGTIGLVDFDGGAFHRTQPIAREHVEAVLRRVSGHDVRVTALHLAATWTDRSLQANTYRAGRILLAGDAAHVHSPLGGQGLNLGLGDALNLGWKLAATIRGGAPAGLLDTYTAERHPVGARVLEWTRAQVGVMQPTPQGRALAGLVRDLIATRDGATYFAERVWGTTLRYDLGGDHPLVGRSCPDFELPHGARVGALLRDGRGLLLDFAGALAPIAGVRHVTGAAVDPLGLRAVLVRPDGVVAWATDTDPDPAALARAAAAWFG